MDLNKLGNSFKKDFNVQLAEDGTVVKSDNNGRAYFNLKAISGTKKSLNFYNIFPL